MSEERRTIFPVEMAITKLSEEELKIQRQTILENHLMILWPTSKSKFETYETFGIATEEIFNDGISRLYKATFPNGWLLKSEEKSIDIFDDKGRIRGYYVYEGQHIQFYSRYDIVYDGNSTDGYEVFFVDADGTKVYVAGKCSSIFTDEYYELIQKVEQYAKENFPYWEESETAYWD